MGIFGGVLGGAVVGGVTKGVSGIGRGVWRLGRPKTKLNKNLMFKNTARLGAFSKLTGLLNLLIALLTVALVLAVCAVVVYMLIYLVLLLFTLGLIKDTTDKFLSSGIFETIVTGGLIALGSVFVLSLLKFLLEKLYIGAEIRELNKNIGENKKYLDVADAVKKSSIYHFLMLFFMAAAGGVIGYLFFTKELTGDTQIWVIVGAIAVVIAVHIWVSSRLKNVYESVEISIKEILEERRDMRQDKRESKQNANHRQTTQPAGESQSNLPQENLNPAQPENPYQPESPSSVNN